MNLDRVNVIISKFLAHTDIYIRGEFNKFPDLFCTGI